MTLAKLSDCEVGPVESLHKCAVSLVQHGELRVEVVVPLEGLVDIEEEIKRIQKNIEKVVKEKSQLSGRLQNKNFVRNAPDEVVAQGQEQLAELTRKEQALLESLQRLR
jgi:valyl-tRNA synthetase